MGICNPWSDNPLGRIVLCTSSGRPTGSQRYPGLVIYETNTSRYWSWNGAAWVLIGGPTPRARTFRAVVLSVTSGVVTPITWTGGENYDTDGIHDTVTNSSRMTVPAGLGGVWTMGYTAYWAAGGSGERSTWMTVNGGTVRYGMNTVVTSGVCCQTGSADFVLAAGDYVDVYAFQNSGGAVNVTAGSADIDSFWATYKGPS